MLYALPLLVGLLASTGVAQEQSEASSSNSFPLERIVMIGASVTGGFSINEPLGGPLTPRYNLGNYLESAILSTNRSPIINYGTAFFFLRPKEAGTGAIDRARKADPTLVVAMDFLFWFCYGSGLTEDARLDLFEEGLHLLEAFDCPVVVGDLPDAKGAIGGILSADQVPQTGTLAKANRRLEEWASTRANVILVPLSVFGEQAMANQQLTVRSRTLPDGQTLSLLQSDKLHASETGCAVLSILILDTLVRTLSELESEPFLWEPDELVAETLKRLESAASAK